MSNNATIFYNLLVNAYPQQSDLNTHKKIYWNEHSYMTSDVTCVPVNFSEIIDEVNALKKEFTPEQKARIAPIINYMADQKKAHSYGIKNFCGKNFLFLNQIFSAINAFFHGRGFHSNACSAKKLAQSFALNNSASKLNEPNEEQPLLVPDFVPPAPKNEKKSKTISASTGKSSTSEQSIVSQKDESSNICFGQVLEVPGDGNCLLYSVGKTLKPNASRSRLRKLARDYRQGMAEVFRNSLNNVNFRQNFLMNLVNANDDEYKYVLTYSKEELNDYYQHDKGYLNQIFDSVSFEHFNSLKNNRLSALEYSDYPEYAISIIQDIMCNFEDPLIDDLLKSKGNGKKYTFNDLQKMAENISKNELGLDPNFALQYSQFTEAVYMREVNNDIAHRRSEKDYLRKFINNYDGNLPYLQRNIDNLATLTQIPEHIANRYIEMITTDNNMNGTFECMLLSKYLEQPIFIVENQGEIIRTESDILYANCKVFMRFGEEYLGHGKTPSYVLYSNNIHYDAFSRIT